MKDTERRLAAKEFAEYWKDKGYERGETQPFWISLLRDVLGISQPEQFIAFEEPIRLCTICPKQFRKLKYLFLI